METREALTMALSSFGGALVLVSHDRHLLRAATDQLWLVHDGRVAPFDGDLDEYAVWLRTREADDGKAKKASPPPAPLPATLPKPAKKTNPVKLAQAEAAVADLEAKLAAVDAAMADPARARDAAGLAREREQIASSLEKAEADFLALYDGA
jgi:ATP-binding cassette subfamily F protein 3